MTIELMRDFDATALVLSNLSAAYFGSYAVVQVPAGLAVESMVKPLRKRVLIVPAQQFHRYGNCLLRAGDRSEISSFCSMRRSQINYFF